MDDNRKKMRALSNAFAGELKKVLGGYLISYTKWEPGDKGNYDDQIVDCQKLRDAIIPFTYYRDNYSPKGSSIAIYIFDDEAEPSRI